MKLSQVELILVGLLIIYISFFTNPVPFFISSMFKSPVGHALALGLILYLTVYESLIVGIFVAIAYVITTTQVTEYMENPTPPTSQKEPEQPKASGVPSPAIHGAVASLLKKGDTRLPQEGQKKGKPVEKPTSSMPVKPVAPKIAEHFADF
jgi:hypothetical protein